MRASGAIVFLGALTFGACGESNGAEGPIRATSGPGEEASRTAVIRPGETPDVRRHERALPQAYTVDRALAEAAVGGEAGARISERMDVAAEGLQEALEGLRVERLSEGIKVTLDVGIPFDEGSAELAPETMDFLTRLAGHLAEFADADALVVGHSDGSGDSDENVRLSEQRALAAVNYLAAEGVERSRLSHLGRGESEPVAHDPTGDESARRENRRIEIAILASGRMVAAVGSAGVDP
jgi:outer membrane protein OmpA-like peptidoglycan-associated protein